MYFALFNRTSFDYWIQNHICRVLVRLFSGSAAVVSKKLACDLACDIGLRVVNPAVRMRPMRRRRWILLFAILSLAVVGAWLWWARPKSVDMATYAPADSLLYLEANRPIEVVDAIAETQAWKALASAIEPQPARPQSPWLRRFIGWTGIGPIKSVILARAQVAVVVTDLRAVEEGDALNIKSEGALLIETHTSEQRIRATFEETIKTLAEKTYGHPTSRRVTVDGVEYSEWIAPEGSRQIVGAVLGTLIVIGTSEMVVQDCLAVSQGRRPSLQNDPELRSMRLQIEKGHSLTFGYVPPANSARLLAVGLPLLLGQAPGDSEFQRLITSGASKVFGSLGWTSSTYLTGIEDRYLITLQPSIVARLKPTFVANNLNSQIQQMLPNDVYSVTCYKFASPPAAWISLKTAVSSQVDALSAVFFSSLLKSALLSYGIDDPESFLGAVQGELLTLRLNETADRSMLIAGVRDRATLRQMLSRGMSVNLRDSSQKVEIFEEPTGELAASLSDEFIVMGSPADVRRYLATSNGSTPIRPETLKKMTFFSWPSSANVVTYTNDGERVRNFISAIMSTKDGPGKTPEHLEEAIGMLPYSSTETTLGERGIERITRSPLGQFSTLVPLLFPPQPAR
jgi:hypothetical protein